MSLDENPSGTEELRLLSAGTTFAGRYRIVRCLGAGGMGAVYEVIHNETQRRRVLKTMLAALLSDADMRARFKLEATITANIESEHIVEVFDAGFDDATGLPFLVMEYLRGDNLARVLRARGQLPAEDVIILLRQASLALERTHAAGIVHRDLKPENLFLTRRDDGSPRLKLLDFGIAKLVAQSVNVNTTRSFGTPFYMSPEQIRGDGDIDGRADLYALGHIAFTLLVGHAYFEPEAESTSGVYPLLLKVVQGPPVPASQRAAEFGVELPATFDAWFNRAAHPQASGRFDTATELVQELSDVLSVEAPLRQVRDELAIDAQPGFTPTLLAAVPADSAPQVATLSGVSNTGNAAISQQTSLRDHRRLWVPLALLAVAVAGVAIVGGVPWHSSTPQVIGAAAGTQAAAASVAHQASQDRGSVSNTAMASPVDAGPARAQASGGARSVQATPSGGLRQPPAVVNGPFKHDANRRSRTTVDSNKLGYDPSDLR